MIWWMSDDPADSYFPEQANMIFDSILRQASYHGVDAELAKALAKMVNMDWAHMPAGTTRLDGDWLLAMVNDYTTQAAESCRFEAHQRYTDIQFMIAGEEYIEVGDVHSLAIDTPFDEAKDVGFYNGQGDRITLTPGRFAVFFPHDAHRPGIAIAQPSAVRKVVIKVDLRS